MILRRLILFLFLWVFLTPPDSISGGWPQPKGGYYAKISEWWIVSDQHFDGEGHIQPNFVEYGYYSTALYAEYGISQTITGIIYFPFINYTYSVLPTSLNRQSTWKTGDMDIGIKYALTLVKPMAISASLIFGLPLGYHRGSPLKTGDGEFNQILRIDAGKGFKLFNSNAWANIYSGYNHRTNGFADEWIYGLETGINISDQKVMAVIRLDRVDALGTKVSAPIYPESLFSNFREYLSFSPEIAYHIQPEWGITIGIGTAFLGKNIFANSTYTFGVFYKSRRLKIVE